MEDNSAYTIRRVIGKRLFPVIMLYFLMGIWESLGTILVANFVSSTAMTIVVICSPFTFLLALLYDSFGYGSTSLFVQAEGRNEKAAAVRYVNAGFTFVLFWALFIALFGVVLRVPLARIVGVPANLLQEADRYLLWMFPGFGLYLLGRFLEYIVGVDNNPRLCSLAKCIQIGVCVGLSIMFMGYYKLGLVGFAMAFVISSVLWLITLSLHFFSNKSTFRLSLIIPDWKITRQIYSYFRIGITEDCVFAITLIIMNHFIQNFPPSISTIYFILLEVYVVIIFVAHGLAQAVSPLIGVYYGEGNTRATQLCYRKLQQIGLIVSGVAVLLLLLISPWIPTIYGYDYPDMLPMFRHYVIILFASFIPFCFLMVNAAKTGTYTGDIKIVMWIQSNTDFIFLLPVLLIAALFRYADLLWLSFGISYCLTFVVFCAYKRRWKRIHGYSLFTPQPHTNEDKKSVYYLIQNMQDLENYRVMAEMFLSKQKVSESVRRKVEHALEEIISYAKETQLKKDGYVDLQIIACKQDSVRIIAKIENRAQQIDRLFRKNFSIYNPNFLNLRLLRVLSREFNYDRMLDMDVLNIVV